MYKKILILKNDRTGDLFSSLEAINIILNKHRNEEIYIFLSKINCKFAFLFKSIKIKIFNFNLNILEKAKILFFLYTKKIDSVYILTPKNFYYFLPFFFRKVKFYGICIDSIKSRPSNFLRKYLYKKEIINRLVIKKRLSTYEIQKKLINFNKKIDNLVFVDNFYNKKVNLPENATYFHYKHKLFFELLNWDLKKIKQLIFFIASKRENLIFSSEINNNESDNFFYNNFNSIDFKTKKYNKINDNNILFLMNIDGRDIFEAINKCKDIVAPEGIITHIGYYLKKNIFALLHFKLKNKQDFINQIISCKEWFPPQNFKYIILSKNFDKSICKINKRI